MIYKNLPSNACVKCQSFDLQLFFLVKAKLPNDNEEEIEEVGFQRYF